jgi:hypothetical protein
MDLLEVANRPGPDHLGDEAWLFAGLAEIAHLSGQLGLAGEFADHPGFIDAVRQRLLAVDMLAEPQGRGRGDGMHVVGRGDGDGVDVLLRLEHLAEIGVEAGARVFARVGSQVVPVGIAQGDDILAGLRARGHVARPHAAEADGRDVEFL